MGFRANLKEAKEKQLDYLRVELPDRLISDIPNNTEILLRALLEAQNETNRQLAMLREGKGWYV